MDREQALHRFWSSFGLSAWDENAVPSGSELPYLTYSVATAEMGEDVLLGASVWYKSASWAAITQKVEEIGSAIGNGGILLPYRNGRLWIRKGSPFSQRMGDPDDPMIRRIYLNIVAEYLEE